MLNDPPHAGDDAYTCQEGDMLAIAAPVAAQDSIDRIELPDAFAGEGITTDGTSLYAGSLADGSILQVSSSLPPDLAERWIAVFPLLLGVANDEHGGDLLGLGPRRIRQDAEPEHDQKRQDARGPPA